MNLHTSKSFYRITAVTLISVLLLGLGPVAVQAHDGGEGTSDITPRTMTGTQVYIIGSAVVTLGTTHPHVCIATATARVLQASAGSGTATFVLRLYSQSSLKAGTRYVQLDGQEQIESVSVSYAFKNLTGTNTFVFTGQKNTAGTPNLLIDSNTMTVACFDTVF